MGFLIYSTPSSVQVPDVVGETLDVAKEKIEVAGLVVGDVKKRPRQNIRKELLFGLVLGPILLGWKVAKLTLL